MGEKYTKMIQEFMVRSEERKPLPTDTDHEKVYHGDLLNVIAAGVGDICEAIREGAGDKRTDQDAPKDDYECIHNLTVKLEAETRACDEARAEVVRLKEELQTRRSAFGYRCLWAMEDSESCQISLKAGEEWCEQHAAVAEELLRDGVAPMPKVFSE